MRITTGAFVAILYFVLASVTIALECPPFPQQASKEWEVEVKAAVVKIGPVKGGELVTRTQNATKDLLSKVPDAGRIYLEQMMYAAYCTALRDDKTISESSKAKQLQNYAREVRNAISQHQSVPPQNPASLQKNTVDGERNNKYGILNEAYMKLLDITGGQSRTIEALIGKLNEKDRTIKERDEKIDLLTKQYAELKDIYEIKVKQKPLSEQGKQDLAVAKIKLDNGDLAGARKILNPTPPVDLKFN